MGRHVSDLEDHHVEWLREACSHGVEHTVCTHRTEKKEALPAAQLANRRRGAQLLRALTERTALPSGSCEVTVQLVDLAQSWSGAVGAQSLQSDRVAMAAGVCVSKKQPHQEEPHTLPDLLGAFEEPTRGVHHRPHQPQWRVQSFTRKLTCCITLGMNWQSKRHRNWWRNVLCGALCRRRARNAQCSHGLSQSPGQSSCSSER